MLSLKSNRCLTLQCLIFLKPTTETTITQGEWISFFSLLLTHLLFDWNQHPAEKNGGNKGFKTYLTCSRCENKHELEPPEGRVIVPKTWRREGVAETESRMSLQHFSFFLSLKWNVWLLNVNYILSYSSKDSQENVCSKFTSLFPINVHWIFKQLPTQKI